MDAKRKAPESPDPRKIEITEAEAVAAARGSAEPVDDNGELD